MTVKIDDAMFEAIDKELENIAFLDRTPVIKRAMRAAGQVVATRTKGKLPAPGYPGDNPNNKPLRDTLGVKVIQWQSTGVVTSLVGFRYEAGGQHGHLSEEGHEMRPHKGLPDRRTPNTSRPEPYKGKTVGMGGQVEGRHDLADAAEETEQAQFAVLDSAVKRAV